MQQNTTEDTSHTVKKILNCVFLQCITEPGVDYFQNCLVFSLNSTLGQ